jgi:thioredoxin-dependent peroxiredoxin
MGLLKAGDKAPDFNFLSEDGGTISLQDFRGSKLVLYFYPKDDTPGCTAEACNLRDNFQIMKEKGFKILGVSADSEVSHEKFVAKYVLPFALIPDKEKTILKAYGAWGKKKLYGKEYEGIIRTTFVIDENGIIEKVFTKVDTKNHSQQILGEMGL